MDGHTRSVRDHYHVESEFKMAITAFCFMDQGPRERQEDCILVGEKVFQRKHLRKKITHNDDKGVFAVCDGMGGHPGGKAASRFFCNRLRADLAQAPSLTRSETLIASLVGMQAASMSRLATGSATTLAGVAIDSRWAVIFNAGDSRVYRWRDRHLQCVSHDHSPVQEMLDHELISEEEAFVHPYRNLVSFGMGPAFTKTWREELLFFRREAMGDDIFFNLFGRGQRSSARPGHGRCAGGRSVAQRSTPHAQPAGNAAQRQYQLCRCLDGRRILTRRNLRWTRS
jgi:serine/threonine protein phosphatase PrpC